MLESKQNEQQKERIKLMNDRKKRQRKEETETERKEERTMGGREKKLKVGRKKSKTVKTNHSPYCKRRKYVFRGICLLVPLSIYFIRYFHLQSIHLVSSVSLWINVCRMTIHPVTLLSFSHPHLSVSHVMFYLLFPPTLHLPLFCSSLSHEVKRHSLSNSQKQRQPWWEVTFIGKPSFGETRVTVPQTTTSSTHVSL